MDGDDVHPLESFGMVEVTFHQNGDRVVFDGVRVYDRETGNILAGSTATDCALGGCVDIGDVTIPGQVVVVDCP